jgi:two-component system sensor histidine kinase KdpD
MAGRPFLSAAGIRPVWLALIGISTLVAFATSYYFLSSGISVVFPHIFYLPIVLAAYRYPRPGVLYSALLGIGYFLMVLILLPADTAAIGAALVRGIIFAVIGLVVALLSARLVAQEQKYNRTFQGSGAGVFLVNLKEMVIAEVNRTGAEMLASTPEALKGTDAGRLWGGRNPDETLGDLRRERTLSDIEVSYRDLEDTERWAILSASLLPGESMVVTAVDITGRKAAEAALRESERVLSTLLSNLPGLAYRCRADPEYTMEFVSEGVRDLTGYTAADLIENRTLAYAGLIHPDDRGWIWEEIRQALDGDRPFRLIYRIITRDGGERWVLEQGVGVRPEGTAQPFLEGFITDITEQVHAKEEVDRTNRQLFIINRIIRLSTTAASLDDLTRSILHQTLVLFGIDAGAVYLTNEERTEATLQYAQGIADDLIPGLRTLPVGRFHGEALSLDTIAHFDSGIGLKTGGDGATGFSASVIPFVAQHDLVGGMVLLSADPGHRFSPEERSILESIGQEMGSAVLEAILQQRLEAANEEANLYLDIMAHDINNANTAAIGYGEFLIGMLEGDARDFARKQLVSVQKSVEIIGNVSTIRRLRQESPKLKDVPLDAVIRGEIARFSDVQIAYPGTDAVVRADDLLAEVLTNLIGNSVKFGGPDIAIAIGVTQKDGFVTLCVEDDGPGIPDADKPHIFSRFKRGQTRKSGKGLGLYITKMLVTRYGGEVWAEDRVPGRPGEGARICLTLRIAESPGA